MAKTETKSPVKEEKAPKAANAATKAEITIAEKLVELYRLQTIDSKVDRIKTQRGELPLELLDLRLMDHHGNEDDPPTELRKAAVFRKDVVEQLKRVGQTLVARCTAAEWGSSDLDHLRENLSKL